MMSKRKETSKIVWTTLLYQVDRCFPLTADVQKVLFRCSRTVIYKQPHAVSSGSARTRSHEKCALKPFILDVLRVWLGKWLPLIGWEFVPLLELSDGRWRRCQEPLRLKTTLEARVQKLKGDCAPIFVSTNKTQKLAAMVA